MQKMGSCLRGGGGLKAAVLIRALSCQGNTMMRPALPVRCICACEGWWLLTPSPTAGAALSMLYSARCCFANSLASGTMVNRLIDAGEWRASHSTNGISQDEPGAIDAALHQLPACHFCKAGVMHAGPLPMGWLVRPCVGRSEWPGRRSAIPFSIHSPRHGVRLSSKHWPAAASWQACRWDTQIWIPQNHHFQVTTRRVQRYPVTQ